MNSASLSGNRPRRFSNHFAWLILLLLGLAVLVLYVPSLSNWAAVDDIAHLRKALLNEAYAKTFLRPLERFVNQLNVAWLGYTDLRLSYSVNLAGFLLSIFGTFVLGRVLYARSVVPALIASLLIALSSLSVSPSLQIDSISQQYATVFALFFFLALLRATRQKSPLGYVVAFSFAALAMLSKESSLGIVAAIPFAVFLVRWGEEAQTPSRKWRELGANYLTFVVIFALYLLLRVSLGYTFSGDTSGGYALGFSPARLVKNVALYFSSLLYLGGSTLDIFPTLKPWRVALSSLFTLILFALATFGIVRTALARSSTTPIFLSLSLVTLAGAVPVIITEQVSELYAYSSLPFFALLIGLGFTKGVANLSPRVRFGALVFCVVLCGWLTFGTYEKIAALDRVSSESLSYFNEANSFFKTTPPQTLSLCWTEDDTPAPPTYSVFVRPPKLLAERAIEFAAFVNDKTVTLPDGEAQSASAARPCTYPIALTEGQLAFSQQQ